MKALMTIIIFSLACYALAQDNSFAQPLDLEATARYFEELADEEDSLDLYFTAACYWALAGDHENAFHCLFYIAYNGFCELDWLEEEDDLGALRSTPNWRLVILHVKSNLKVKAANQRKNRIKSEIQKAKGPDEIGQQIETKSSATHLSNN